LAEVGEDISETGATVKVAGIPSRDGGMSVSIVVDDGSGEETGALGIKVGNTSGGLI
jgi:hypothetical protein